MLQAVTTLDARYDKTNTPKKEALVDDDEVLGVKDRIARLKTY